MDSERRTREQHARTRASTRAYRRTQRRGYTLCLHSPITDSRSYAIMIDLPAWLMTGELSGQKVTGMIFERGEHTSRAMYAKPTGSRFCPRDAARAEARDEIGKIKMDRHDIYTRAPYKLPRRAASAVAYRSRDILRFQSARVHRAISKIFRWTLVIVATSGRCNFFSYFCEENVRY